MEMVLDPSGYIIPLNESSPYIYEVSEFPF